MSSFAFSGSASNVTTTLMSLTSTAASSTGSISLSNSAYSSFQTAFVLSNATTPSGSVSYNFGDATNRLEALFNQSSNTLSLNYNGTNLSTSNVTLSGFATSAVLRFAVTPSNISIRSYVGGNQIQNFTTSNQYSFSPSSFTHSWVGSNAAGSAKYIDKPLINSIQNFYNPVEIQGSLKANNISVGNATITSSVDMRQNKIYLKTNADNNHVLTYSSAIDGVQLWGWQGGQLLSGGNGAITNLRWTSNGFVGINNNSPTAQLDVTGVIKATTVTSSGGATLGAMQINDFGLGTSTFAGFNHQSLPTNSNNYAFASDSNGISYINCSAGKGISFRVGNVPQASINADGSLWLGAPSSGAYSLSNQGTMCTSNVDVKGDVNVSGAVSANQISVDTYFTVGTNVNLLFGGLFKGSTWSQTFNSQSPANFNLVSNGGFYQRMGKIVIVMASASLQVTGSAITNLIFRISNLPIAINGLNMVTGCFSIDNFTNSGAICYVDSSTVSLYATGTFSVGYHTLNYTITYVC